MRAPGFSRTMAEPPPLAPSIRRQSRGSSFETAGLLMPRLARRGMRVLYAYCRVVDDLADESASRGEAWAGLEAWRSWLDGLEAGRRAPAPGGVEGLAEELDWLCRAFAIPPALLKELLDGAESDLRDEVRFEDEAGLARYCHQVAGVVGLACLPLFGVEIARGREFAETLGLAFQLTNILRDAREDAGLGRVYFPAGAFRRFGVDEKAWLRGEPGAAGLALLESHGAWAAQCFEKAARLRAELRGNLRPADLMADVYGRLLKGMRDDGYRVFGKRYRVSTPLKLWFVARRFFLP